MWNKKRSGRLTFVFTTLGYLGKKPGVDFVFELVLQVFILSKHMGAACGKEATKGGKGSSGVHVVCVFRLLVLAGVLVKFVCGFSV